MKKLFNRHGLILLCLVLLGTVLVTSLTLKATFVTIDLAIDSYLRMQYNESLVKTDEMTKQYEEDLAQSELKKSSANFVERFVANMPFVIRILFLLALIRLEVFIFQMYRDFIKFIIRRRKAKQQNPKRKPE